MHRTLYLMAILVAAAIFAAPAGAIIPIGPDLVVDWVVPNPPCEEIFANENNTYCTQITNYGTNASEPFNVTIEIGLPASAPSEGFAWYFYEEVEVAGLDPDQSVTICVEDGCPYPLFMGYPPYGQAYRLVASLSGDSVSLRENGNYAEFFGTVVYNGYKGKLWTNGNPDGFPYMTSLTQTSGGYLPPYLYFRGDVAYSTGDSSPAIWEGIDTYAEQLAWVTWNWEAEDIPIPAETPILYSYLVLSYDHAQQPVPTSAPAEAMPGACFPVNSSLYLYFNDNELTPVFHSWDRQMFPEGVIESQSEQMPGGIEPDFQNGIVIYPVGTFGLPGNAPAEGAEIYSPFNSWFVPGEENCLDVYNDYGNVNLRGALLVVLYEDENETCKEVYIMHGDDMLCANSTLCTDESETYGFGNFLAGGTTSAPAELGPESGFSRDTWVTLHTFASGADYEGKLYALDFYINGQAECISEWFSPLAHNAWWPMGDSDIGVNVHKFTFNDDVPPVFVWQAEDGECFDTLGAIIVFEEPDSFLTLAPGWNYVSVPGYLRDHKNTFGWLFGDIDTGNRSVWLYDNGVWTAMGRDDVIEPMYAYWVYVDEEVGFLVTEQIPIDLWIPLFWNRTDWTEDPPTRELVPGWNAISSSRFSGLETAPWATISEVLDGMSWEALIHWQNGYDNGLDYWQKGYDQQFFNDTAEEAFMEPYLYPYDGYWVKVNETGTIHALEGWGMFDPCYECVP
jgi:hypothetical protein